MWTSDRRLYLTREGKVSETPDSGGKLLVPVGGELSDEEARQYGLIPDPSAKKERKGAEDKGSKDLSDKSKPSSRSRKAAPEPTEEAGESQDAAEGERQTEGDEPGESQDDTAEEAEEDGDAA